MPLFLHLKKIKNGVKNEMKVKEYKHQQKQSLYGFKKNWKADLFIGVSRNVWCQDVLFLSKSISKLQS